MALDMLERDQIEDLIDHLKEIYPNQLDAILINEWKRNILKSNEEASSIIRELSSLFKKDEMKLKNVLMKYQVGMIVEKQNIDFIEFDDEREQEKNSIGYKIEELEKMTEGMLEDEIVQYLSLHGKNPGEIMMILLALEQSKEKKEQAKTLVEKPNQKVLKNNKLNRKMAAFVNTLTLAFLVGMVSGIVFFVMLRIILHSLY